MQTFNYWAIFRKTIFLGSELSCNPSFLPWHTSALNCFFDLVFCCYKSFYFSWGKRHQDIFKSTSKYSYENQIICINKMIVDMNVLKKIMSLWKSRIINFKLITFWNEWTYLKKIKFLVSFKKKKHFSIINFVYIVKCFKQ